MISLGSLYCRLQSPGSTLWVLFADVRQSRTVLTESPSQNGCCSYSGGWESPNTLLVYSVVHTFLDTLDYATNNEVRRGRTQDRV